MDIQLPQILFQIVNFSIIVGALSYLLYKPVQKIFEERSKRIEEGLKAAEANIAEQNRLKQHEQEVKQQAQKEAAQILEEAQRQAQEKRKSILSEAKKEGAVVIEKMKSDWETEKAQIIKNMKSEMVDAVITTAEKVVGNTLDKKAHAKLIDQEIDAISQSL